MAIIKGKSPDRGHARGGEEASLDLYEDAFRRKEKEARLYKRKLGS